MKEIELKARVRDPKKMRSRILPFAVFDNHVEKSDEYFARGDMKVRIRREKSLTHNTESLMFTHKVKHGTGVLEINDENEFPLLPESYAGFTAFLQAAGFRRVLTKEKKSSVFIPQSAAFAKKNWSGAAQYHVELTEVPPLGWFIEIEALLADTAPPAEIRKAEDFLAEACKLFSIDTQDIEPRWYSELLSSANTADC